MKDIVDHENPRQHWLGILSRAPEGRICELLDAAQTVPDFTWLRAPEIGSTMVRARAGGTGAVFNLGEVTVTRCALTLETGEVGHSYLQGRRKEDAQAAALVDALMQTENATHIRSAILDPLEIEAQARMASRAAKAAATKVEFFTMTRGEDE